MADYGGLDPSVLGYLQGGGMPSGGPAPAVDPSMYGLDPSVLAQPAIGYAPQQLGTTLGPKNADPSVPQPPPAPPLTPVAPSTLGPRGRQQFGIDPSVSGAPGSPEVADTQVPSVTGGTLPTQDASVQQSAPVAAPLQPDQAPMVANVPSTPQQVAASNKQYAAAQAKQTAYENSTAGLQAKADADNAAVLEKERQDQMDAQAVQVAKNDAIEKATVASNARIAKDAETAAAQRAADQASLAKDSQAFAQQMKDAADYKVNTNRDIGLGGIIAVALSGIGDAIAHRTGPNAALEIINKKIDQGIADQWAQKKALGDKAAGTKDILGVDRENSISHRQDQDSEKGAALLDAQNQIANIVAQSANPELIARGKALQTAISQQAAGLAGGMAQRKLEADKAATEQANKVAERGIQWAGIKQNDVHFNKTLDEQKREHDLQRQDKLDDLEKQYIAMGNKALADKAKELKTSGIFDGNTAAPLIDASNPAAQPALLQAKRLDQQAAAATDPQQQATLAKQAADLRNNVNVQFGATLDGPDRDKIIGAQRLINSTQRIRDALEDGSITDRDTRASLKTEADTAFTAWAETNKVKASSREYEVYKEAIGALDGVSATNINKGPLEASLKALDRGTQDLVGVTLRGHGIKAVDANGNPWAMTAEKAPQGTKLSGATSAEQGDNATPGAAAGLNPFGSQGFAAKAGRAAGHFVFGGDEPDPVLSAENKADTGPSGLSKEDDSKVLGLIKTYGRVSTDENQRVISQVVNLVSDADDPRKQATANSVITRIKAESPILYKKVIGALPADRRRELTQFDLPPVVFNRVMGQK